MDSRPPAALTMELVMASGPFAPGDAVEGTVEIHAEEAEAAVTLAVRLICEEHVENAEPRYPHRLVSRKDVAWPAGGGSVPFRLELPGDARETFCGRLMRTGWTLEVDLNRSPRGKHHAERGIEVKGPARTAPRFSLLSEMPAELLRDESLRAEKATLRMAQMGGALALGGAIAAGLSEKPNLAITVGGIVAVPLLALVATDWWRETRVGTVAVRMGPVPAFRGDAVLASLRLKPRGSRRVERVAIALVASERADHVGNDEQRNVFTHRSEVARVTQPLDVIAARETVLAEGACVLPADAPFPFHEEWTDSTRRLVRELAWSLEIKIECEGLMAWTRSVPLPLQQVPA